MGTGPWCVAAGRTDRKWARQADLIHWPISEKEKGKDGWGYGRDVTVGWAHVIPSSGPGGWLPWRAIVLVPRWPQLISVQWPGQNFCSDFFYKLNHELILF